MSTFEFLPESDNNFDFAIKCLFNKSQNKIRFEIILGENAEDNLKIFLNNIKENLYKLRTLSDTKKLIQQMSKDSIEPIKELGIMLKAAADSAWIDLFLDEVKKQATKNS